MRNIVLIAARFFRAFSAQICSNQGEKKQFIACGFQILSMENYNRQCLSSSMPLSSSQITSSSLARVFDFYTRGLIFRSAIVWQRASTQDASPFRRNKPRSRRSSNDKADLANKLAQGRCSSVLQIYFSQLA